jgi:hypothetical protein
MRVRIEKETEKKTGEMIEKLSYQMALRASLPLFFGLQIYNLGAFLS